jgi:hypothetical protein
LSVLGSRIGFPGTGNRGPAAPLRLVKLTQLMELTTGRAEIPIYANTTEAFARNASLTAVGVQPSALTGTRKIVEVIFSYRNRENDVTEKFFVRVDVSEEFPFLITKLSRYYDR